jgi:ribonuclease BN (tRNA processing enzyme)
VTANATNLRAHLKAAHISTEEVDRIATEARLKRLALSHFVPGGLPPARFVRCRAPYFSGRLIGTTT